MPCPSCTLGSQVEFGSEMMVHFSGLRNVDNPGVWISSNLLVCLDCGFAQLAVPKTELALLGSALANERLTAEANC